MAKSASESATHLVKWVIWIIVLLIVIHGISVWARDNPQTISQFITDFINDIWNGVVYVFHGFSNGVKHSKLNPSNHP